MTRYAIFALAALAACSGDKTTDSGDTGPSTTGDDDDTVTDTCPTPFTGPVIVTSASVTCDAGDANVTYYAETDGWTADGMTFAQETANVEPQYSDEHTIESFEFDECGAWDHLHKTIAAGAAFADAQMNVNTVFSCADHFESPGPVMSYAVGVMDIDGNFADCLAWGEDPADMIAGTSDRVNEPSWSLADCVIGSTAM